MLFRSVTMLKAKLIEFISGFCLFHVEVVIVNTVENSKGSRQRSSLFTVEPNAATRTAKYIEAVFTIL